MVIDQAPVFLMFPPEEFRSLSTLGFPLYEMFPPLLALASMVSAA